MSKKMSYYLRWALLMSSGAVVFQATSCWDVGETGFLAFIAGTTYYLARNV